jgi:hypothetical protein
MKKPSSFKSFIKKIVWIAVLIVLTIISIRAIKINKEAKGKNRTEIVVGQSFPKNVSNELEIKDSQSNSTLASIKPDIKTNIENKSSIDQEDHIFKRHESENDRPKFDPNDAADRQFSEIHEPFLQNIGVSQDKIEDIYDFYMEATLEIDNINKYRQFLEDFEMIGTITENYNDYVMELLGKTDGEKYEFFTNSLSERTLTNKLNSSLDKENQLDNDQLEELTKDFYNIRVKYYDIKHQVGAGVEVKSKIMERNQTPEEIKALIKNEYIDFAENILTETQLEMLKNILNGQ